MRIISVFIVTCAILSACASKPQPVIETIIETVPEAVIEIKEPEFEILSIAIIRGELINTLFETVLKIDNPNSFPVELSSIKYELYGNGMFWADGLENNLLHIPAMSSSETKFRFSMNFIDMNRRILDDVIAMRQVQYIFKGNAQVKAVIPRIRSFTMDYNISGLSEVKPKAD